MTTDRLVHSESTLPSVEGIVSTSKADLWDSNKPEAERQQIKNNDPSPSARWPNSRPTSLWNLAHQMLAEESKDLIRDYRIVLERVSQQRSAHLL